MMGLAGVASDESSSKVHWFTRQSFERRISALEQTLTATQRCVFSDVRFPKALEKVEIAKCVGFTINQSFLTHSAEQKPTSG